MSAAALPTVEDLTREYQARLSEAARRQYPNERLVKEWFAHLEAEGMGGNKNWKRNARHLLEWLDQPKHHKRGEGTLHILSLTRTEAQAWLKWVSTGDYAGRKKQAPLKAGTVLTHAICASSLFNYFAEVRGLVVGNPFRDLQKTFKRKNRAELRPDLRAVDENDVAALLEVAEDLDSFLIPLLLFKTGVRVGEAVTIRMAKIDWQARVIELEPHPKRTYLRAFFDEETEPFLRLKCERNQRDHPGNPFLFPSKTKKGGHLHANSVDDMIARLVKASSLAPTVTGPESNITPHSNRRGFTSVLKRNGCPSHVVATLRGDSLQTRSELTPDPTQGIYTKFGSVGGKPELRYWFDKCMPVVGAREIWGRVAPTRKTAATVAGLIRATKASVT